MWGVCEREGVREEGERRREGLNRVYICVCAGERERERESPFS